MSLAIAIDQITRPTWWVVDPPPKRASTATVQEKYDQVMLCLNAARGPVNCACIEDYTGYTTQSCRHLTAKLIEQGRVRKIISGTQGNMSVTFEAIRK